MTRATAVAIVLLLPCATLADDAPWRFGGELLGFAQASTLEGVGLHSFGLRLGLGGNGRDDTLRLGDEIGWVIAFAGSFGQTGSGLQLRDGRLGIGARARFGRITFGLDAEGVLITIDRVSLPGTLSGTGIGGRALVAADLVRISGGALVIALDGGLAMVGSLSASDASWLPDIRGAIGFRW